MIDTIHLRVIELRRYPELLTTFRKYDKGSKEVVAFHNAPLQHQRFIHYHNDTGTNIVTSYSHKFVASHHYEIAYKIDYTKDCIDFNISIPKYMFGHNLKMCVKHKTDRDYNYTQGHDIKHNLKDSYSVLMRFVNQFNLKYLNVDRAHILLKRIDLCFNRFFTDKVAKSQYLFYLKGRSPKYTRSTSNNPMYKTGIYRSSRYHTCKIYDKGIEFAKHDKKKLVKLQNTDELQAIANKILRYEVEFKDSFFKRFVALELKKEASSSYLRYVKNNVGESAYNRQYKDLSVPDFNINFSPSSAGYLNKRLYGKILFRFYDFLQTFSVGNIQPDALHNKINAHNNYVRLAKIEKTTKLNDRLLKKFVDDLATYGRNKLLQAGLYPRSTYYRNIKKLKDIGFASPEIISPISFVSSLSLDDYHSHF